MIPLIKLKNKIFYNELFSNLLFVAIIASYILLKAISNLAYGASYFIAFRSGIMGAVMYVAGMYTINLASNNSDENKQTFLIDMRIARIVSAVYFIPSSPSSLLPWSIHCRRPSEPLSGRHYKSLSLRFGPRPQHYPLPFRVQAVGFRLFRTEKTGPENPQIHIVFSVSLQYRFGRVGSSDIIQNF